MELLKAELGIDPNTTIPEDKIASIEDVRATVEQAKQTYDDASKKHTGARKWLEKFSGRLMYYGAVLDALSQHHPEYVALAWGTVKFVLMVRPIVMYDLPLIKANVSGSAQPCNARRRTRQSTRQHC